MDFQAAAASESRFAAFVEGLASVIGHADRASPLRDYCTGLMLPCERKSVEPMAAVTAPSRTAAQHQSLLHFIGQAEWSDDKVLAKIREMVLPALERHGPVEAWIIDDTGFPKKGRHSVGVARQYCGQLGKQDNCQVAVSLSLANHEASLPVAYRLYLPEEWAEDCERRKKAGVPEDAVFKTKPEIALEQIVEALSAGLPRGVALMDAGYGVNTALRTRIGELGLFYVAGVPPTTTVRDQGKSSQPVPVKELAYSLPAKAWRKIAWREGSAEPLSSRFARLRVRAAHGDGNGAEEWLLIEWPKDEKEPTKYWLSTVPADTAFDRLVDLAKLRWRIERDYQELKQEVGLSHYEGRGWRGFHHHATMCIAAYGFLISEREMIPPSGTRSERLFKELALPGNHRPRGAPAQNRAARSQFHRHHASAADPRPRQETAAMPMLPSCRTETGGAVTARPFVTQ